MRLIKSLAVLALIILAAGDTALAQSHSHGHGAKSITVVKPWSRATAPSQKAGGVFLTIENKSDKADRLVSAESDMADVVSLHTTIKDGDVMKMRPVEGGIVIPANGSVELKPGGNHVMLIGLRGQLVKDSTIPLTLVFEHAGRVDVSAVIGAAGAHGAAAGHGGHGQHGMPTGMKK